MSSLNQAKVMKAVEGASKGPHEEFLYSFLKAYGVSSATVSRLKLGDKQRNIAKIAGDLAVPQQLYFREVNSPENIWSSLEEIKKLRLVGDNDIRFILVTDFHTVVGYDSKVDDSIEFDFASFKQNYEFFLPMSGQYEKPLAYAEHPADVKACEKMGRLYDQLKTTLGGGKPPCSECSAD